MKICDNDKTALKAPEFLIEYLSTKETPRGLTNGKQRFTCSLHAHKHPDKPHLRVEERNGEGVAVCDSYGVVGDIFATAAGYGDGGGSFPDTVQAVAGAVGYTLRGDDSPRRGRRSRQAQRKMPPVRPQKPAGGADGAEMVYLPTDAERAALGAVRRAAENPAAMVRYVDELGIPLRDLMTHTDMELAGRGLLGLSPDGHLLYVYAARDGAGAVRVLMVKQRSWPEEVKQGKKRFYCGQGSHKQALYGAGSIGASETVIITEGESDCLAVRAALDVWLDYELHCEPDTYPPPELIPAVVAKPDAGTFKQVWAAPLRGRDVILCVDNDSAGRDGAERTADILLAAGACRVFEWQPKRYKDFREAFRHVNSCELIDDLLINKKLIIN